MKKSKNKSKFKRKKTREEIRKSESKSTFNNSDYLHLHRSDEYFLGFKRKNYNNLWRWDTLEDVKI